MNVMQLNSFRKRLGEFFMSICEHHAIPRPINRLFKDKELIEFLYTNVSHSLVKLVVTSVFRVVTKARARIS